jgi:hypothetical protein
LNLGKDSFFYLSSGDFATGKRMITGNTLKDQPGGRQNIDMACSILPRMYGKEEKPMSAIRLPE